LSEAIIDEIDRVLAAHYGFPDDELIRAARHNWHPEKVSIGPNQ